MCRNYSREETIWRNMVRMKDLFPIFTKLFVPNKGHVNFKTQKKCLVCHGEKLRHYVEVHQWMNMLWFTYLHHHTVAVHIVHYDKKSFCLMLQIDGWRAKNSCICTMCHDPFLLLTKASQMSRLKLQLNDPVMDTLYFFTCKRVSNSTIFIFEKPENLNSDLIEKYILSWYLKYFQRWLLWHIYETYLATGLRISMSC